MNKELNDLISELASKMAINDLMYDARVRYINDYNEKLEKLFTIPIVNKAQRDVCPNCDSEKVYISYHYKESLCAECDNKWYWG